MKTKKDHTRNHVLVGITGGIGAGKSALAAVFSRLGYPVLSADALAREVVAPGSPALQEIVKVFGSEALLADGGLNRAWVRSEIARDSSLRLKLEAITHPRIQALSLARSKELFSDGALVVFYEAPLLFEAKSEKNMDAVICVHAPDKLRVARVVARDGVSTIEAERLLAAQMPQEEKMKRSDYLVLNDGDQAALERRAREVLAELVGS